MTKITRISLAFCALLALVGTMPAASAAGAAVSVFVEGYTVKRTGTACAQTTCAGPNESCPAGAVSCAPAPGCLTDTSEMEVFAGDFSAARFVCKLELFVHLSGEVRAAAGITRAKLTGTVSVTTPTACFSQDATSAGCGTAKTRKTRPLSGTTVKGGTFRVTVGPFEYGGGLRKPASRAGLGCATPTVVVTAMSKGAKTATVTDKPIVCD